MSLTSTINTVDFLFCQVKLTIGLYVLQQAVDLRLFGSTTAMWPVGLMDKASASGAGDSRLESWAGHFLEQCRMSAPHPCQICQNSTSTNGHAELSGCAHQMSGPESPPLTLIGDAGLVWYKDARCDSQGDFNPCRLCPMDFGYINLTALSSSHLSLLRA